MTTTSTTQAGETVPAREPGAADAPLALKDIALTLMRSAATTEESAA